MTDFDWRDGSDRRLWRTGSFSGATLEVDDDDEETPENRDEDVLKQVTALNSGAQEALQTKPGQQRQQPPTLF